MLITLLAYVFISPAILIKKRARQFSVTYQNYWELLCTFRCARNNANILLLCLCVVNTQINSKHALKIFDEISADWISFIDMLD